MATMNRCEAEVDAIRDRIMEETKHLTREENNRRLNEQTQRLAAQYGFRIVDSAKETGKQSQIDNSPRLKPGDSRFSERCGVPSYMLSPGVDSRVSHGI